MDDRANVVANIADGVPRRRGAPPGSPKPPGSGRQKGTRNKVTKEIAAIAQKHGKAIISGLVELFESTDNPDIKIKTAGLVLSYGYGSPVSRREVSGPGGAPIEKQTTNIIEASERVSAAMAEAATAADPGVVMDDAAIGATQAINFVIAAREAAQRKINGAQAAPTAVGESQTPVEPAGEPLATDTDMAPVEQPAGDPPPPEIGHTLAFTSCDWRIRNAGPERPGLQNVYELRNSVGLARRGPFEVVLGLAREQVGDDLGPWIDQPPPEQHQPARPDQMPLPSARPEVHRRRPR